MKTQARVVVIGGGIAGCSLLYHLTKLGWRDVVLVERNELTAGSTWHAAGNTPHFEASMNMARIQHYSTQLYGRLEAETGQATGFHKVGSLRIAQDKGRLEQFKMLESQAKNIGLPFQVIGPGEIKALMPFVNLDGVIAAAHTPDDGYVDPSSCTQAMAKGARDGGATIYRKTRVIGTKQKPDGTWIVETDKGNIACEIVVNAAGTWAKDVGKLAGLELPIVSMEHQYLVTEALDEVTALGREFPLLRDPDASFYLRQEGQGILYGPYEAEGKPWAVDGIPEQFGQDLLPNDLDRIEYIVEMATRRVPMLAKAGIKRTVNGPIPHTPDGGPLIGPAPGLRNYWCLNGFSVGIAQGGGAGKALAEWIVEDEPPMEMFEFDPRRYGPYATTDFTVARSCEIYRYMYAIWYPNDEKPAGRPAKTTPVYERLKQAGAVFEARFGWERPAWFAPDGKTHETPSFRRAESFSHIAAECRAVRERVGLLDLSAFSKYEISGPGAERALDRMCANRLPQKDGAIALSQLLTPKGKIESEATIVRWNAQRFYAVTAGIAQLHDRDWFLRHLPKDASVAFDDVTLRDGCLILAGPKSRDVLSPLTRADLSNRAFPWLAAREIEIAGVPVRALRCNYVGELGWELHHNFVHQTKLYDALIAEGAKHGLAHFGTRAMNAMRLEKAYRAWGTELTSETDPIEAGLERLVKFDGRDFIGHKALEEARAKGHKWRFAILAVDVADADAPTNAPIFANGAYCGVVSSGGYGHTVGTSIALAFVMPPHDAPGTKLEIEILGERRAAKVVPAPLYDPENTRPRL